MQDWNLADQIAGWKMPCCLVRQIPVLHFQSPRPCSYRRNRTEPSRSHTVVSHLISSHHISSELNRTELDRTSDTRQFGSVYVSSLEMR